MQTTLPEYAKPEFSVVRQHEEFIWLHDRFDENETYAGFIVNILVFFGCLIFFISIIFRFI